MNIIILNNIKILNCNQKYNGYKLLNNQNVRKRFRY